MFIDILAAASAATEAPQTSFGFVQAIEEGGPVTWSLLAVLAIQSVGSFYILITKWLEQNKVLKQFQTGHSAFWRANSLAEGATRLEKNSAWRQLVDDALAASNEHKSMTDSLEAHDWLHGTLARSESTINSSLAAGLPFLATTGATAPFVGLLGTVIGIYRTLINIGIAGSAALDKIAGPIGEALIMTAIGLLVAVPAVFAYNFLQSRNKKIAAQLSGFSTELLANIASNGAVKPAVPAAAAKAAPAAAKPAPKA